MIYVFAEDEDRRYVKIGYTRTHGERPNRYAAKSRLSAMQIGTWRKLVCIAMAHGSRQHEKGLHNVFSAHHKTGEWFECSGQVLEWVSAHAVDQFESTTPVNSHAERMEHHTMKKNNKQRAALKRMAPRSRREAEELRNAWKYEPRT